MPLTAQGLLNRQAAIGEILPLRHAILRPGLPLESAAFDGDRDPLTAHFGVFDGQACVACVSYMPTTFDGEDAWQLRGMAVRADMQRKGLGRAMLAFAHDQLARRPGRRLLWCNARIVAAPFYQRLGWTIVSGVFDVPTVGPHYRMTARLPG